MSNGLRKERGREGRLRFSSLLAALKSVGTRSSSVVEDAYARGASSLLDRLERLEDGIAQRRFQQRSRVRASDAARAPRQLSPSD